MKTRLDETNKMRRLMGLSLKEQLNDEGGEDHFLRHKTVVDYDATVPMEWKECSADIKNHNGPVLLFFGSYSCPPCVKLKKNMDKNENFQKWAQDNNVIGLYMYCEKPYWVKPERDTRGCSTTKCSDGKTLHDDIIETKEIFGGAPMGSGMATNDGKWRGAPKLFITDSSFNKKNNVKTGNPSDIDNLIKTLEGAL
tara:strand:- start:3189 stop:3776 length:588 start_codon:yes stop_codon:yes gene_type:complete